MLKKVLSSNTLHAALIVFVMVAASFVLLVQTDAVSAQASDTQLVVGLQNPAVSLNFFDVATNSVWKAYMLEYNFEALYTYDPASAIYSDLANNTMKTDTACASSYGSGWVAGPLTGMCHDAGGFNYTVDMHTGVTFADPAGAKPMTAKDVVLSYESLSWSTNAQVIYPALWWPQPMAPLWNSTTYGGSCAEPPGMPYACMSHTAVWALNDYTVRFQLFPVYVGATKGAYALFFYATMVVPIIPTYIWENHMGASALVNWSDPSGGVVSDTWDRGINTAYSAVDATIGTGPFYLANYVQNSETLINVFPDYWGNGLSHNWAGKDYGFFPKYITSVRFVIFTSLDVVSLALQQGTIDTLVWSLTAGFYSQVQSNPAITVATVTDSGYYYLSFNMRRQPWDDVCLREAISMAIDKTYIVNTLMGGFGVAGSVPIGLTNPDYVNATAVANAVSFDPTQIGPHLEACGYTKDPATGFYKAPASEGGQVVTATILTPPKDYDPIRADAGIMISKNLKAAGVNIASAPTSFDTIVARGLTYGQVDYDIYVLGWSLGIFPEAYLCSFFCSNQDVQTNPAGSNSAGYSNAKVDSLINELTYTVNNQDRQKLVKDVEGIVTHDLPWNVLYFKKLLSAYRNDKYQGWLVDPILNALSAGGGPFNFYTLVNLEPASATNIPPPSGALSVATTVPQRLLANHVLTVPVYVSQNGAPVADATVTVSSALANNVALSSATGTTDMTGTANIDWKVPVVQGDIFLTVTATSGSSTGSTTKQLEVTVGPPAPMALLSLSTPTPVIHPSAGTTLSQATVTASLVDSANNPISGITVHIDPTLILGGISPSSAATDASGQATFTYTAPDATLIPNADQLDTIRANVTVPNTVVGDTQTATLAIFVQNDNTPDWSIVSVQGTPPIVFGPTGVSTSTITVKVSDWGGVGKAGVTVVPKLPAGNWNVSVTPASAVSDANGLATFTVDDTALTGNVTNVLLRFSASGQLASTSDSLDLLVTDGVATGYAAQLSFSDRAMAFAAGGATSSVTATVYNELNATAAGVAVLFQIGYGDLGIPAQFPMPYTYVDVFGTGGGYQNAEYGGTGLDLNSFGQGSLGGAFQNSTGPLGPTNGPPVQGPGYGVENFINDYEVVNGGNNYATNTTFDSCDDTTWPADFSGTYIINATSVTDTNGHYSTSFTALPMPVDNGFQVTAFIGPAATPTTDGLNVEVDACNFVASINNAVLRLDSGLVAQRAPGFALGSVSSTPVVTTSEAPGISFTAHFYTLTGPASSLQVFLVRGQGSATRKRGATRTTGTDGSLTVTDTMPILSLSQAQFYAFLPADSRYAFGGREQLFSQTLGDFWFGPTFEVLIAKFPYAFQRGYLFVPSSVHFATATPANPILAAGASTQVKVSVVNGTADYEPAVGASVWSGSFQGLTDSGGNVTFSYTAGLGASEGWVYVTTSDGQVMRAWFGVMALNPILSYGDTITPNVAPAGSDSTFTVTVTNQVAVAGTATVLLTIDGATVAAQQVSLTASQANVPVTFHYVFTSAGSHTVGIGTASYTASVPAAPSTFDPGTAYALAIGLLVVGVVVGVLVGMLLARRRKKPTMAMPEEPTEAKPAEEELPPEDKL
jgi:ABC-type transport system substrate-binding protein